MTQLVPVITYTGPTAAASGAAITLKATLKGAGKALPGRTVTFTLDGVSTSVTTNASGIATLATTAPTTAGSYPITVAFAGDSAYAAASKLATLTVA